LIDNLRFIWNGVFQCPNSKGTGVEKRVSINDLITQRYETLSPRLRTAADYVVGHCHDVASRSLRAVAASSDLNPPTYSRLARALGLNSYEEMRELCRNEIKDRSFSFAEKASLMQIAADEDDDGTPFALQQSASAIRNIDDFAKALDIVALRRVADRLVASERVFIAGSLASVGFAQYFGYLANLAFSTWQVVGQNGVSLATALTGLEQRDALLIVMKNPYAQRSVDATQIAHEAGAYVVVISDSMFCPAFRYASQSFIVPTESPQFFSSYVATLVLLEALMGMVIRRAGTQAAQRLKEVERNNHRLGEYWPVTKPTSTRETK